MINTPSTARLTTIFVPRGAATRGLLRLLSGAVLSQLLLVAITPLVARFYSPDDFSQLGLFASFLSVAVVASTLKYESAIVSADSNEDADYLLVGCVLISAPIAAASLPLAIALREQALLGFDRLPDGAVWWMVSAVPLAAMIAATRQWLIREQRYTLVAKSQLARATGRAVSLIVFGFAGFGWAGLYSGELVARAAGSFVCGVRIVPTLACRLKGWRLHRLQETLRNYARFPLHCLPSRLADSVAAALPAPLLIATYGPSFAGEFVLVQQLLTAPLGLVIKSVSDVFHRRMAECVALGERPERLIWRTSVRLLALAIAPAVLLTASSTALLSLLLGPQWTEAGAIAAAIAPWLLAQFVVAPTTQTMSVFRSYDVKLRHDLASVALTAAAIGVSWKLGASASTAVQALGWSRVATYVYLFALTYRVASRATHQSRSTPPSPPTGSPG